MLAASFIIFLLIARKWHSRVIKEHLRRRNYCFQYEQSMNKFLIDRHKTMAPKKSVAFRRAKQVFTHTRASQKILRSGEGRKNWGRVQPFSKPCGFESDVRHSNLTSTDGKRKRGSGRVINIRISRVIDDDTNLDDRATCRPKGAASVAFQSRQHSKFRD